MDLVYTFDPKRFHLGSLCHRNHKWPGTNQSLRRTAFDKHGKKCSKCVGCAGNKSKHWLTSFVDHTALGLASNQKLGSVCKGNHLWHGHQMTLRVNGKCRECERIRNRRRILTPEQREKQNAYRRNLYYYDSTAAKARRQAIKNRMEDCPEFAEHVRQQRRKYKEQARRRAGMKSRGTMENIIMQKAIREAGRLPDVVTLVANEQNRYWQKNPEAKRQAKAELKKHQQKLKYLTDVNLRLYHREKSRRRKLKQKKQTVCRISVIQLRGRFSRFDNCCAYCGSTVDIQIEHVVPISMGGLHHINNVLPACRACNYSKAAQPLEQWYRSQPFFDPNRLKQIKSICKAPEATQLTFELAS